MATCKDVIESAYRRSTVQAAGVRLNATQTKIGLERLRGLYLKMMGDGLFGIWCEKYLLDANTYVAREDERVVNAFEASVELPAFVTCGKDVRAPKDGVKIQVIWPTQERTTTFLYDAYLGRWVQVDNLELTSEAPLSSRYEEGIKDLLAVLLADENGYAVRPVLARNAGMARLSIGSRYDSKREPARGTYF